MNVLLIIIFFSFLILVHEWGHFFAARRAGVFVHEFGLGFPPRLVAFYKDPKTGRRRLLFGHRAARMHFTTGDTPTTIYSVNAVPIGGFVRLKGEDEQETLYSPPLQRDSLHFGSHSLGQRALIVVAGVLMNVVFAWLLFSIVAGIGMPTLLSDEEAAQMTGRLPVQVIGVAPQSPADKVLEPGDLLLKFTSLNTSLEVKNIQSAIDFIKGAAGSNLAIKIERAGKIMDVNATPRATVPSETEGRLGITLARAGFTKVAVYEAPIRGFEITWRTLELIVTSFANLLYLLITTGSAGGVQIAGPVGIVSLSSHAAAMGLNYFLQLMAILSLNLAVINALPIPALDGGRLLFFLIEWLKGSAVSLKTQRMVHTVGFALLLALIAVITLGDLRRLL